MTERTANYVPPMAPVVKPRRVRLGLTKLYVCYGFLKNVTTTGHPGGHPSLKALREAGHEPVVEPVGGLGVPLLDRTSGWRKVNDLTGRSMDPVLETDDRGLVYDSKMIVESAEAPRPATP